MHTVSTPPIAPEREVHIRMRPACEKRGQDAWVVACRHEGRARRTRAAEETCLRCHCDTRDGERRAHVEAAPAEPQNEGPENLQHRRMAGQRDGRLRLLVEAADARADDDRTTQPGDAASH
eukprot:5530409-Prymnesium_polylepis.1